MFEEVKEMIDSTVYENGRGEVTAKNLNLGMHAIVDATEEELGKVNDAVKAVEDKVTAIEENGTGGGAGALKVWMPVEDMSTELTPEQIAENVATYNEIVKGEPVSVVLCQGGSVDGMTVAGTIPTTASYTDFGGNKTVVLLANQIVARELVTIMGQLYSDGSVAMFTETFEVPAASGPLRVWMYQNDMSELTQQQVDDNIATYNAIASGDTTSVLVCVKFEDDSLLSVSTYHATSDYVAYSNGQKFVTLTIYGVDADLLVTAVIIELNADGTITME